MRSGKGFETIECYTDLAQVRVSKGSTVLLECMSNLVANEMFQENGAHERTVQEILKGVKSLLAQAGNLVIVTNEIFSEAASYEGETETDLKGAYVCPAFLDGHIHLESSMVSPSVE